MINIIEVLISLDMMWKGMLGLFLVSIFIMFLVMAIKYFMQRNQAPKET